ncbi:hypothetical protein BJF85_17350 [Saccharomonospora sp. CUA-673]|nr:hypothetical protein BJF85_17350 [Saccharomonospora sp. CUA-673]
MVAGGSLVYAVVVRAGVRAPRRSAAGVVPAGAVEEVLVGTRVGLRCGTAGDGAQMRVGVFLGAGRTRQPGLGRCAGAAGVWGAGACGAGVWGAGACWAGGWSPVGPASQARRSRTHSRASACGEVLRAAATSLSCSPAAWVMRSW